ncbi:hypothetical protein IV203_033889 [Nitzschia inconspicua]|uniref:Uncharacterized protein n=1 Tax=Nitzschia inconspicua TaxID=303405 RepID=A0A9K3Q7D7_9STRA|nr:hypothetical protein IV203_033889 [Nitzschia inconspicua]
MLASIGRPSYSTVTSCLAQSSPDVASLSWLVVNITCLAFSLHLAAFDLWSSRIPEEDINGQGDVDDDAALNVVSASGRATVEYLVWSLVTTVVWIVEVALRTAFPSVHINKTDNFQTDAKTADLLYDESRTQQHHEQSQPQEANQQRRRTAILVMELMLAIFFLVESIFDCLHWKARVKEDDVLGEEVSIWINSLGYMYMSYESFTAAASKRKGAKLEWDTTITDPSVMSKTSQLSTETPPSSYINMATIHDRDLEQPNAHGGSVS